MLCACVYVCVFICIHVYVCVISGMDVCVCMCVCVCVCVCVYTDTCVGMCSLALGGGGSVYSSVGNQVVQSTVSKHHFNQLTICVDEEHSSFMIVVLVYGLCSWSLVLHVGGFFSPPPPHAKL